MNHVESNSEVINHEVVDESNAGLQPEAANSFSVSDDDILRKRISKSDCGTMRTLDNHIRNMSSSTVGQLWASCRDRGTLFLDFFDNINRRLQFRFPRLFLLLSMVHYLGRYAIEIVIRCSSGHPRYARSCAVSAKAATRSWSSWVVMVCFSPNLPVTLGSMNYSAPVLVGLFLIILTFWVLIGDEFKGPNIDWKMLNLKNEAPSSGSTGIVEPDINRTASLDL
ncbi:Amino acid/polyamine transporter I [Penicillium fimorum]|uniref:Amino acid/polyamine transporter I n=1 Tax=Penicillium fimorum TaxID=1882269 RepID=A0A9X0C8M1_9EURO|nr:Amino acid/polyamine transporter I [Penicillium fimorum]